MGTTRITLEPLPAASFGAWLRFDDTSDLATTVAGLERAPDDFTSSLQDAQGLLVLPGMQQISDQPELLVRLPR